MKLVLKNSKLDFQKKNPRVVILNNYTVNNWQANQEFFVDSVYNEVTNRALPAVGDKLEVKISAETPFSTPATTFGMYFVRSGNHDYDFTELISAAGQTLTTEQTYTFTVNRRQAGIGEHMIPTLRLLIKGTTTTPALTITIAKIVEK